MKQKDEKFEEKLRENISVFDKISLTTDEKKEIAQKAISGAKAGAGKRREKWLPLYYKAKRRRIFAAAASFAIVLTVAFTLIRVYDPDLLRLGRFPKYFGFGSDELPGGPTNKTGGEPGLPDCHTSTQSCGEQEQEQSQGETEERTHHILEDAKLPLPAGNMEEVPAGSLWAYAVNDNLSGIFSKRYDCASSSLAHYPLRRAEVRVVAGNVPVPNVPVYGLDAAGNVVANAFTDMNGNAYLYSGLFGGEHAAIVYAGFQGNVAAFCGDKAVIPVTAGAAEQIGADIMFIFENPAPDSEKSSFILTHQGSMIADISSQTGAAIRLSPNLGYYDGEYLTSQNSFNIGANTYLSFFQSMPGSAFSGLSFEEWIDAGISGYGWRQNAVRLCVLVLENPRGNSLRGWENLAGAAKTAQELGVRFIPVLTYGKTEGLSPYRTLAAATGGTTVFLFKEGENLEDGAVSGAVKIEPLDILLAKVISYYLIPTP